VIASAELLHAALRLVAYISVLALAGAASTILLLRPEARGSDTLYRRTLNLAVAAAAALTLARLAQLYGQTWIFFGEDEGITAETLRTIAMDTLWGEAWKIQLAGASFALLGALGARRGAAGVPVLGIGSLVAAASQPLTGHAVTGTWLTPAVATQTLHVLAAGCWLGSLIAVYRLSHDPAMDDAALEGLVSRFSPLAIVGAATLAASGAFTTYLYLAGPLDLFTTPYGRLLLAKIVGFAAVAALGYQNWQRVTPLLGEPAGTAALQRTVRAELGLALAVLAITAILVVQPLPAWGTG
jgi:putative copper export protein